MFYIVGLGNPGEQYQHQRHNIGFMVLDELVSGFALPEPVESRKHSGKVSVGVLGGAEVTLLYPSTFMNNSGTAVQKLVPKGEEKNLLLIYDDVDIPLGEFKLSVGRGDGGHNGVKSVIAALGTKEFMRLRVGIMGQGWFGGYKRPTGTKLSKHVLGDFTQKEMPHVETVSKELAEVVRMIVTEGVVKAMNTYN